MIRIAALFAATLLPAAASALDATSVRAGELRVLDKVTGRLTDMTITVGAPESVGALTVLMNDCRVPADNPTGDAYAELLVTYRGDEVPAFSGWMIASAPALNAMDHPRYDVWVIRCST